jgi:hypothetical protein
MGGKKFVALSMYAKGKAFGAAAVLLNRKGESDAKEYVVLHLLSQSIECVLKGLLLLKDYDTYSGRLQRPLGHNLLAIATAASKTFRCHPIRSQLADEIRGLTNFYSKHRLRYGMVSDMFIDPRTIPHARLFHRLVAVMRLAERELRQAKIT